jgi:hypothetical protein
LPTGVFIYVLARTPVLKNYPVTLMLVWQTILAAVLLLLLFLNVRVPSQEDEQHTQGALAVAPSC